MTRVDELNRIAFEVLDAHAQNLETEFSTFEEFQDLFVDVLVLSNLRLERFWCY